MYQVGFGEDQSSVEGQSKFLEMQDWVVCDAVEGAVITTQTPISWGLLGHHVEGESPAFGGWSDNTNVQHVIKLFLCNT